MVFSPEVQHETRLRDFSFLPDHLDRLSQAIGILLAGVAIDRPWGIADCFCSTSGTIIGTVRDPQGAVVPKASITTAHIGTGASRSVMSDSAGGYVVPPVDR
jgi:hypothetical protein